MRITFLNPVGTIGGGETSLLSLITGMRRVAPEVHLELIAGEEGPLLERVENLGVRTQVVRLGGLRKLGDHQSGRAGSGSFAYKLSLISRCMSLTPALLGCCRRLRASILRTDPDVVHSNGMKMHVLGALCTPARTPVIWHIHDYVGGRLLMKRLLQSKVKRCGMLIGVSRSVVEETRHVLKCSGAKIRCVYNSVDSQVFSSVGTRADLDRLAGLAPSPPGTIRVGLPGTFARWKGHKTFLAALSAIPRSVAVRGYIVGGPVYSTNHSQYSFEELKAICRNLAIEDRIGFTGFCDRPAEIIRSLDIVVHASDSPEPFGMVLAEAMIAGTPIISTGIGGSAELCTDGVECLTFQPGNAADLASKIVRLGEDASLRRRMIAAGMAKAERRFRPERAAGEVLSVYRGLMGANFALPGSIGTAAQESAEC